MMKYTNELLRDIISWDIRNWGRALRVWDSALAHLPPHASALEVGAREGGLSLYLALKGCQVVCSDVENPQAIAQARHSKHQVQQLISYTTANAAMLPFEDQRFDVVAFKSILGAIGRDNQPHLQEQAICEIHRVLKPGGILRFADNLSGTALHRYFRKMTRWGRYWRYVQVDEMRRFHHQFSEFNYNTFGFLGAFGRNELQRHALHHIDTLINPMLKDHHKYIIFGYARK